MDISKLFKAKQIWDSFGEHHPKFREFLKAVYTKDFQEGMIIEVSVRYPDGSTMRSNMKVTDSDIDMWQTIR